MASLDSSLQAGLTALKQENYEHAIAILEAVCQTQGDANTILRAQMGLVIAYQHTNQISRAIDICHKLTHSNHQQIKTWALRHLAKLQPQSSIENDRTGFVAFLPEVRTQESEVRIQESEANVKFTTPASSRFTWRQAARAKQWQPLPKVNLVPFWLLQLGTAIALFWLLRELISLTMSLINALFVKLPYLEPIQLFYRDSTPFVIIALLLLSCLSPWLLDGLLRLSYASQPLSTHTLSTHSPEALRVLQRYCRQRGWQLPKLYILPLVAPIAFTYGNLPKTARIVVSQGLLAQLAADEIATIYAAQLAHITNWDFAVMSLVTIVTVIPYTIYCQVSQWGEQTTNLLRYLLAAIANLAYAVWYILSLPALLLSQVRIYYSDRASAEISGNPNALKRALVKISQGITADIQQQNATNFIWESYQLVIPICYRQAIGIGSLDSPSQLESVLSWDCLNPARYWLNINNTHPLIGDRLQRLAQIAHNWHLEAELNLPKQKSEDKNRNPEFKNILNYLLSTRKTQLYPHTLLLQGAPFFGIIFGFAFGCLSWLIGIMSNWFQIPQLSWMYGDWFLILGCLSVGFSVGTLIRINVLFPDIKSTQVRSSQSIPQLLANSTALPIDSQPVRLQGKLLGRCGISNWLSQNLILESEHGLVILHHQSAVGHIGKFLWQRSRNPINSVGENVVVTGWFRRGATAWIDLDTLRTQSGINRSAHPIWSTILASASAVIGTYIILQGGR